jgi:hypothetical protein
MNSRNRLVSAIAFMILVLTGATLAQVRTEGGSGSLAALIAEVRQLRLAVEESNLVLGLRRGRHPARTCVGRPCETWCRMASLSGSRCSRDDETQSTGH